jgi:hypothetical protein
LNVEDETGTRVEMEVKYFVGCCCADSYFNLRENCMVERR